jgi:hypothetical protein
MLMSIIKKLLLVVLTPLLPLLLFSAAAVYGIMSTVGQPSQVKKLAADSGLYQSAISNVLDQQKSIKTSVGDLPLSDPSIRQAANQAFSPALVQKNTEAAIDNIYDWLDGKTPSPTFSLNFLSAQGDFANNLAAAVQTKAASLPDCKTPYTATSFDVYSATCLPKGVSPASVAQQVKSQVAGGQGFIDKPIISASDIKNSNGQSVFSSQLKSVPSKYQWLKKSPWLLMLLSLIVATGLVLLRPTLASGLRHVGLTVLLIGLFMLLFSWGIAKANHKYIQPNVKLSNAAIQSEIKNLIDQAVRRVDKNYWLFGGAYSVIGAGLLVSPRLLNKKRPAGASKSAPPSQPAEKPPQAQPAPQPTKPKPAVKRTIKIQ